MATLYQDATQPLDKVSLQIYQLFCMPNYLQLVKPFVSVYQSTTFDENDSIRIYDLDYHSFMHFLQKCAEIFFSVIRPDSDVENTTLLGTISLTFGYRKVSNDFFLKIYSDKVKFEFDNRLIPVLISGVAKLLFKSYGYSGNVNYLVSKYVKLAPSSLIQNPTYPTCYEVFKNFDTTFVDFFYLFELVDRHKKVLCYLKLFEALNK